MEQPKTLQAAIRHFSDEQVCIDTVARLRWPNGPECPACDHKEHYYLATQKRWKCKECYKQFTVKLGTIFEDSPIKLDKWLTALWMLVNCKNGVSSYEIAKAVGITQKSAWFVLHRLRFALQTGSIVKLGGGSAPVEVDETFVGGKARNMHKSRRLRMKVREHNWAKTVVMGMLERGGQVKTAVIPERHKVIVDKIVRENILPGAEVHTDEFVGYSGLSDEFTHKVINHLEHYVDGKIHTQGIENFWSLLKRGLSGTYVAVEPFHLFRYVDEQAFRYNHRKDENGNKLNDGQRFELALSQIAGKRLTFAEVTGKVGETAFFLILYAGSVAGSPLRPLSPRSLLGVELGLEHRVWDRQDFFESGFKRSVFTLLILCGSGGAIRWHILILRGTGSATTSASRSVPCPETKSNQQVRS